MPLPPVEGPEGELSGWTPDSWRRFPAEQQPVYADPAAVEEVYCQLAALPPLVTSWEVEALKSQLAEAASGKAFLLQGGDCAESFDDCTLGGHRQQAQDPAADESGAGARLATPVIRVGRFAGQYAKPRSADPESRGSDAAGLSRRPHQPAPIHRPRIALPTRSCCCAATNAPP